MILFDLFENAKSQHATFCFGRMNPPTIGHKKLFDTVKSTAQGTDFYIFVSHSQDPKNNPLDYDTKVKFLRKMFPEFSSNIVHNSQLKTIIQIAEWLYKQGYIRVTFVAGSDRLDDFKNLLTTYNGKIGSNYYYKFDKINFVNSGDRKADSSGIEGVSASAARAAAQSGDIKLFSRITGAGELATDLFHAVRKGMLIEYVNKFLKEQGQETAPILANMLQKVRLMFPYAKNEQEALALYILNKEESDIKRLQQIYDHEKKVIDHISDLENDMELKLSHLSSRLDKIQMDKNNKLVSEK